MLLCTGCKSVNLLFFLRLTTWYIAQLYKDYFLPLYVFFWQMHGLSFYNCLYQWDLSYFLSLYISRPTQLWVARAVSPLGREVVCHIKSPFLLLLQLHSKRGDRGRDCAWQHYSQASRKIAVLLPISVTVIQVQPVLCDAWYIYRPRGLLKHSALSLLCCSFFLFFDTFSHFCNLAD